MPLSNCGHSETFPALDTTGINVTGIENGRQSWHIAEYEQAPRSPTDLAL